MADFLDEDPIISNQKYFVLSYTLPKDNNGCPMVKVRGSFADMEDCEKRIKRLRNSDTYFHMYVAEVGKWGPLLTEEQLRNQDIDSVYMNKQMNEIIQDYKENADKRDREYKERKESLRLQAQEEGTKEGQEKLANKKESPVAVKYKIENCKEEIKRLERDIQKVNELKHDAEDLWKTFTQEEKDEAEEEYNKHIEKTKEMEAGGSGSKA